MQSGGPKSSPIGAKIWRGVAHPHVIIHWSWFSGAWIVSSRSEKCTNKLNREIRGLTQPPQKFLIRPGAYVREFFCPHRVPGSAACRLIALFDQWSSTTDHREGNGRACVQGSVPTSGVVHTIRHGSVPLPNALPLGEHRLAHRERTDSGSRPAEVFGHDPRSRGKRAWPLCTTCIADHLLAGV